MLSNKDPLTVRYCWQCGESIEETRHLAWRSRRGEIINLHTRCGLLMVRGLLAGIADLLRLDQEGNDHVTDAR